MVNDDIADHDNADIVKYTPRKARREAIEYWHDYIVDERELIDTLKNMRDKYPDNKDFHDDLEKTIGTCEKHIDEVKGIINRLMEA